MLLRVLICTTVTTWLRIGSSVRFSQIEALKIRFDLSFTVLGDF